MVVSARTRVFTPRELHNGCYIASKSRTTQRPSSVRLSVRPSVIVSVTTLLQGMFPSPSIAKLMLWHSQKRSNREGGDNLVRHPCDSKLLQHFHDHVDPTFGEDARNAHFVLVVDGVNPFQQNSSK
jgi:hypothetical protein